MSLVSLLALAIVVCQCLWALQQQQQEEHNASQLIFDSEPLETKEQKQARRKNSISNISEPSIAEGDESDNVGENAATLLTAFTKIEQNRARARTYKSSEPTSHATSTSDEKEDESDFDNTKPKRNTTTKKRNLKRGPLSHKTSTKRKVDESDLPKTEPTPVRRQPQRQKTSKGSSSETNVVPGTNEENEGECKSDQSTQSTVKPEDRERRIVNNNTPSHAVVTGFNRSQSHKKETDESSTSSRSESKYLVSKQGNTKIRNKATIAISKESQTQTRGKGSNAILLAREKVTVSGRGETGKKGHNTIALAREKTTVDRREKGNEKICSARESLQPAGLAHAATPVVASVSLTTTPGTPSSRFRTGQRRRPPKSPQTPSGAVLDLNDEEFAFLS